MLLGFLCELRLQTQAEPLVDGYIQIVYYIYSIQLPSPLHRRHLGADILAPKIIATAMAVPKVAHRINVFLIPHREVLTPQVRTIADRSNPLRKRLF